ncbi:hypothetical protein IMZ48_43065 [Candidatus Bathyarchaeota archaeon]|nr:hypothetical protein [Candidatus Bathyarchaeota archaeon]
MAPDKSERIKGPLDTPHREEAIRYYRNDLDQLPFENGKQVQTGVSPSDFPLLNRKT